MMPALFIVACIASLAFGMLIGFLIGAGGCEGDVIVVGKVAMCR